MSFCEEHTKVVSNQGEIKAGIKGIRDDIKRLDNRINGTFDTIGDHIKESPEYRTKIDKMETLLGTIKQEKLNSVKASQWRIGLICGGLPTIVLIILKAIDILMR